MDIDPLAVIKRAVFILYFMNIGAFLVLLIWTIRGIFYARRRRKRFRRRLNPFHISEIS